jgi:hypothetical protein
MEKVHSTKKEKGEGGGIINLRSQNVALLLKHLVKFYNWRGIPWVNLIRDNYYPNWELPMCSGTKAPSGGETH